MASNQYDLLIVGGGIAGSTLARAMALSGAHVLVVEKERSFTDRIRGEIIMPWGSVEAASLGIYDILLAGCANEVAGERFWANGAEAPYREFRTSTPHNTCGLSFYHPEMQELLLAQAMAAGAEVWRGASVGAVYPGSRPSAEIAIAARLKRVDARLIVGADGRGSHLASLLGFGRSKDETELFIGGFQLANCNAIPNALNFFLRGEHGLGAIIIRTRAENCRAYLLHHKDALPRRLSGARDYAAALDRFRAIGIPEQWLKDAAPHGILASFEGAHRWIDQPPRDGCVLIGDAAGTSDPVWGNGLSRTLRDVRLLRDRLLADRDWHRGAAAYAADHDDHFQRLRRAERLSTALFFSMGAAAERRRERAFALFERYPGLYPDTMGVGPDAPLSDETIRLFLDD
ncbi:FAD-dependent oxidoreductase [Mesorhizobium sp. L-8-3]|uniref:FAD-dependent oxidoreductase n=1 Tax=Mesorhizobium sp. L-8-3 TaxID=2744522 RepID=UPI001925E217|nr:FAD-dependent monooxygenase [Mesorhizobium sp. L-8-3]BCH24110.1 hypothetical protein MesoLjLb_38950 [Mesorhizobium sp. L-8-3]